MEAALSSHPAVIKNHWIQEHRSPTAMPIQSLYDPAKRINVDAGIDNDAPSTR
jgi:hypothetical protein